MPEEQKHQENVPNEGVDLHDFDVIKSLHGSLDLGLVCTDIHDKDQSVVVLDLLHGRFCCHRMLDDRIFVKSVEPWSRYPWVFRLPWKAEGVWPMKPDREPLLLVLLGMDTLGNSLPRLESLARLGAL